MALYDWNHDGKKDRVDDYIEYQIYKNTTKNSDDTPHYQSSGGGSSTFGAILAAIGGAFLEALLFSTLGIDVENVPALVLFIVWAMLLGVLVVAFDELGL